MVSLLTDMLQFNPYLRPTAMQCIKNPVFDSIRVPEAELNASDLINLEIDMDPDLKVDYDNRV